MRQTIFCLLILLLSACSLQPAASTGEIVLTVIVNTTAPEQTTFTPLPPATATQVAANPTGTPQTVAVNTNCVIRTDLVSYTVVVGDSLSSIAVRTNSTVAQLLEWNCLANANMIIVGTRLQVAREAIPPTLTPTPTPLPTNTPTPQPVNWGPFGALAIDPARTGNDWTDFIIDPQNPITIIWSGIDPEYYVDVSQIEFFYHPDNGTIMSIGIDTNKNDGMMLTWTSPATVSGAIFAYATYRGTGYITSPIVHIRSAN
jgi:LysM repeat protein